MAIVVNFDNENSDKNSLVEIPTPQNPQTKKSKVNGCIIIFMVITTIAMICAGIMVLSVYQGIRNTATYNPNCVEYFNFTCGFCSETDGDQYYCKNNTMVRGASPESNTYFVLGMCLLLVNPVSIVVVFLFLYFLQELFVDCLSKFTLNGNIIPRVW